MQKFTEVSEKFYQKIEIKSEMNPEYPEIEPSLFNIQKFEEYLSLFTFDENKEKIEEQKRRKIQLSFLKSLLNYYIYLIVIKL